MTTDLMSWALTASRDADVSPTAALLLVTMAARCDHRHEIDAPKAALAEQVRVHERQVHNLLRELEDRNLIRKVDTTPGWPVIWALQGPPDTGQVSRSLPVGIAADRTLSYAARGLLSALLATPGTPLDQRSVMARSPREGRDSVRRTLIELVDAGYLQLCTVRAANGRRQTTGQVTLP